MVVVSGDNINGTAAQWQRCHLLALPHWRIANQKRTKRTLPQLPVLQVPSSVASSVLVLTPVPLTFQPSRMKYCATGNRVGQLLWPVLLLFLLCYAWLFLFQCLVCPIVVICVTFVGDFWILLHLLLLPLNVVRCWLLWLMLVGATSKIFHIAFCFLLRFSRSPVSLSALFWLLLLCCLRSVDDVDDFGCMDHKCHMKCANVPYTVSTVRSGNMSNMFRRSLGLDLTKFYTLLQKCGGTILRI